MESQCFCSVHFSELISQRCWNDVQAIVGFFIRRRHVYLAPDAMKRSSVKRHWHFHSHTYIAIASLHWLSCICVCPEIFYPHQALVSTFCKFHYFLTICPRQMTFLPPYHLLLGQNPGSLRSILAPLHLYIYLLSCVCMCPMFFTPLASTFRRWRGQAQFYYCSTTSTKSPSLKTFAKEKTI